jgi:hypothetical protein
MKLKNAKLGEITVKDILENIRLEGKKEPLYEEAYKAMRKLIEYYLDSIEE